eukprot:2799524-Alexandrium_andersonii.AAC.1
MCIRDSLSTFEHGLDFDGGQHGFAEGVPDFGAVTSWRRSSGSETPKESTPFICFQADPSLGRRKVGTSHR